MPNPDHLGTLRQGVDAWNRWRRENPGIRPDLNGVNLRGADLRSAKLRGANLREADLRGAILSGANFIGANLRRANLSGATLYEAILSEADLSGANLHEAILSNAIVGYTTFANVDLSTVRGIESIRHEGPSTIGIDTIYRSQGNILEIFLRGAGVPDNFIEYMHSLVGKTVDFYSCFISYSTKDQEFADRLYADLQAKDVRCWYAPEDLKIGDPFRQRIDDAIRLHDKLLVVLSETSVASSWVESEVESALERERINGETVLFPIRLDEAVMKTTEAWAADIRRKRHMGDFRNWQDHNPYLKAFERLLRDLKGAAGSGPA